MRINDFIDYVKRELGSLRVEWPHLKRRVARIDRAVSRLEAGRVLSGGESVRMNVAEIARALLTARVKLDQTVGLAVERYLDARRDYHLAVEHASQLSRSKAHRVLEQHKQAFRRILEERESVLDDLRVAVEDIEPGTPVDYERMMVFDEIPTILSEQHDTVSRVHQPLFWYRTEAGEQVVQAHVDRFVFDCQRVTKEADPPVDAPAEIERASSNGEKKKAVDSPREPPGVHSPVHVLERPASPGSGALERSHA